MSLISVAATLEAEKEAAMNQAKSASRAAETLMDSGNGGDSKVVKELETKLKEKEDGALSLVSNLLDVKVHLKLFFRIEEGQKRCGIHEDPGRKLGGRVRQGGR